MRHTSTLWKANAIAFVSSFCVMVIELIAARILAPHIGVSLYTWASIISIILAGIALGNYLGGKIADKYPSPSVLAAIFLAGGLATTAILPATNIVTSLNWFGNLPVMWNFTLKTSCIFFIPAIILSMVSPMVIKLALTNLGQTGGIVGTIYACSTAGSILGTFLTGFYFILLFGTGMIVWIVATVLILMGIVSWFSWPVTSRWKLSLPNFIIWTAIVAIVVTAIVLFQLRAYWQETYTKESNYYTIRVIETEGHIKKLFLDNLIHSYVDPKDPTVLKYVYLKVFEEITRYTARENQNPRVLHLGGGGYSFPRYMETIYPGSMNEVVEIDPAVTQVAHEELGLPRDTSIKTYNQDARLFLIQRKTGPKYNIVIGDVFNDRSTPYHLTTLEFARLVKANMEKDGIYLVNVIDDYTNGRYMPSFIRTLRQAFSHVYLFKSYESGLVDTFVIAATDRLIDVEDYADFVTEGGRKELIGTPYDTVKLWEWLTKRDPILLTDDHAPTDILVAPLVPTR